MLAHSIPRGQRGCREFTRRLIRFLPGARSVGLFRLARVAGRRLFGVYVRDDTFQQVSDLGVHAAARHIAILCHRHVGMAEMVGADPRRETGIVNERCYRLAEAMRGGIWHPELSARAAPLSGEVFGVAQRAGLRCEDHFLLADERPLAALGQRRDGEGRQWNRSSAGRGLRLIDTHQPSTTRGREATSSVMRSAIFVSGPDSMPVCVPSRSSR